MSSLEKMLLILDLFDENISSITIDDVVEKLDVSIPTGYRYLKALCDSGLLSRVSGGLYIIGPKIIKLDLLVRIADPVISSGKKVMHELATLTGCEVLISNIYNDEVINVHSESPNLQSTHLSYHRGRPHPFFRGATSLIVVANLPRNRLQKLYNERKDEIVKEELGNNWNEFNSYLSKIRRQNYFISHGQLDEGVSGIAAPIFDNDVVTGSITLILPTSRFEVYNTERLIMLVRDAAQQISDSITASYADEIIK